MRKTAVDMVKKYTAKYNPTVVGTRFENVRDVAIERYQEIATDYETVRELVFPILDNEGITGGLRGTYIAFLNELYSLVSNASGKAAEKIALGIKAKFVTAFGLDPAICDKIIGVILGYVPQPTT